MEKISIKIDDKEILASKGLTILEVALANNIYIPHLCYHPDLRPAGICRLCFVEVEDGKLVLSCRTPVEEAMSIKTKSTKLDSVRRPIVEMLIANHHIDCRGCPKTGRCELQKIKAFMRIDRKSIQRLRLPEEKLTFDSSNPFFERDLNKCVLCGICVRTCQEIMKVNAIDFVGRGYNTKITTFGDKPIAESRCVSCGECVVRCPVGALVIKDYKRPATEVKTVCPYCSVGCGIYIGIRDNNIVSVRGDKDSSVNKGLLCVKGRFGLSFIHSQERLRLPMIRKDLIPPLNSFLSKLGYRGVNKRIEGFVEVSWDEALEFVAGKLKDYSGKEFALLASPYCTNEDNYVAQKFARVVMGSNNIDNPAQFCQGTTISAMFVANGGGIIACNFEGLEKASCIIVTGSNPSHSHPIAGLRIKSAVERGAKLIVINPIEIDLCRIADVWLRLYPGTDVALFMGMCKVILDEELFDIKFIEERCERFEEFRESLEDFPLGRVERITGVPRDMIENTARLYATSKPASIIWSGGISKYSNGADNVIGLLNLAILTGNIINLSGLNALWGRSNAFGGCYMGCLPDYYPGYQLVSSSLARERFENLWGRSLNPEPGLTFAEILSATEEKKIKTLYIIGSNPVKSIAPAQKFKKALENAEFIVIQDIFPNETAQFAHVIFPSASFAEKDGTYMNTEGRTQRINKAIEPVGDSRPDWQIICDLAKRMGIKGFDFKTSEEIMSEINTVVSFENNSSSIKKEKFKFKPLEYRQIAEVSDVEYPLILLTESNIYSSGLLTKKVNGLNTLSSNGRIHINPKDALDFGISDGEKVKVISRWGEMDGIAVITDTSSPGIVTMLYEEEVINRILNPAEDKVSRALETKVCAVRIIPSKEIRDE
ncbi:MAG: molybdopterin-dependent oxidoreductase [Thermodesulfovibrionales bacterium]